ncbi:insulinase family protein [soil metagenome]
MPTIRAALGLVLALSLAPLGASAAPTAATSDSSSLPQDPALRRGVLPNGLRYAAMRNALPKGAVSLRLYVEVGSREETEAERGAAHFVEHMAFRGARHFQDGELERALALIGVGAGRDHNADTSVNATSYRLDLTDTAPAHLDLAFRWLRDVADGITFEPAAMDRERGVVLAEKEARDGPGALVREQVTSFVAPRLRSTLRDPIGTDASLRAMTPEVLEAFHARWYRPETAWVVMVGDMAPEAMEAEIAKAFSSWTGKGPPPARAARGEIEAARGLEALVIATPQIASGLSACKVLPDSPPVTTDAASLRRNSLRQVWQSALNARLTLLTSGSKTLLNAAMTVTDLDGGQAVCFSAAPNAEAWDAALAAGQDELRRFGRDGPTELEVEAAVAKVRNSVRSDVTAAPTQLSSSLATYLAHALAEGWVVMEPRASLRAFNQAVEEVTPADVKAAFAADWSGSGPFLTLTAPNPPTREALLASWRRGEAGEGPAKYADAAVAQWAYGPLGDPGKIARRDTLAAGITRVTFRNGVILNLKKTGFENGAIALRLWFGTGRGEVAARDFDTAGAATGIFPYGALGKHSYDELRGIFGEEALDFDLDITPYAFKLEHVVSDDTLSPRLRLLTGYMTDPGFRDTLDAKFGTEIDNNFRDRQSDLWALLREAVMDTVAPGLPLGTPDRAAMERLTSKDLAAVLKTAVTHDPIEVTLVGDMDEAAAIDLTARTLGALPSRGPPPKPRPDTFSLRFPATPPPQIDTVHYGSPDKAAVAMIWPLYVAVPARRKEEDALKLLAEVFGDELRHQVREHLGKTYSPTVFASTPDYVDQGELDALVETHPADLEAVRAEMHAVAKRLAAGQITSEMLEAARSPMLSGARAEAATNDWWAEALSGSAHHDEWLQDALHQEDRIKAVTLAQVKAAAATWLAHDPIVAVIRPAKGANGGAR